MKKLILILFITVMASFTPSNNLEEGNYIDPMACAERAFNIHGILTDAGYDGGWASFWADMAYDSCMTLFE